MENVGLSQVNLWDAVSRDGKGPIVEKNQKSPPSTEQGGGTERGTPKKIQRVKTPAPTDIFVDTIVSKLVSPGWAILATTGKVAANASFAKHVDDLRDAWATVKEKLDKLDDDGDGNLHGLWEVVQERYWERRMGYIGIIPFSFRGTQSRQAMGGRKTAKVDSLALGIGNLGVAPQGRGVIPVGAPGDLEPPDTDLELLDDAFLLQLIYQARGESGEGNLPQSDSFIALEEAGIELENERAKQAEAAAIEQAELRQLEEEYDAFEQQHFASTPHPFDDIPAGSLEDRALELADAIYEKIKEDTREWKDFDFLRNQDEGEWNARREEVAEKIRRSIWTDIGLVKLGLADAISSGETASWIQKFKWTDYYAQKAMTTGLFSYRNPTYSFNTFRAFWSQTKKKRNAFVEKCSFLKMENSYCNVDIPLTESASNQEVTLARIADYDKVIRDELERLGGDEYLLQFDVEIEAVTAVTTGQAFNCGWFSSIESMRQNPDHYRREPVLYPEIVGSFFYLEQLGPKLDRIRVNNVTERIQQSDQAFYGKFLEFLPRFAIGGKYVITTRKAAYAASPPIAAVFELVYTGVHDARFGNDPTFPENQRNTRIAERLRNWSDSQSYDDSSCPYPFAKQGPKNEGYTMCEIKYACGAGASTETVKYIVMSHLLNDVGVFLGWALDTNAYKYWTRFMDEAYCAKIGMPYVAKLRPNNHYSDKRGWGIVWYPPDWSLDPSMVGNPQILEAAETRYDLQHSVDYNDLGPAGNSAKNPIVENGPAYLALSLAYRKRPRPRPLPGASVEGGPSKISKTGSEEDAINELANLITSPEVDAERAVGEFDTWFGGEFGALLNQSDIEAALDELDPDQAADKA